MSKRRLEPFHRTLDEHWIEEHQRKFLSLPLPIFRDFTNIRSIIIEHNIAKNGKPLKEIEIKHKIEKCHKQMTKLRKWKVLHLDELDFIWPDSERV